MHAAATHRFFDKVAKDGLWHSFAADELDCINKFIDHWQIRPGSRILEPGCGRGRLTELLWNRMNGECEIVAVDISDEMIAAAHRRGLPSKVEFRHASITDVSPARERFDYVICCNVWPHFTDQAFMIRHINSLLTDGGGFWIAHLCGREQLNRIHAGAGEAVCDHVLQPADDLAQFVSDFGFRVESKADLKDRYWIHAVKVG